MNSRIWFILCVLMVAETVSAFELAMILASLGEWQRILGDPVKVGGLVSSFLLVSAVAAALLGRLGDLIGRKETLAGIMVLAGIGSLISAATTHYGVIIFGRALQGATGATLPLCYGLVRELLPKDRIPFGVGVIIASASAASAVGLLVGGIMTDWAGPQSIFWLSAGLAFVAAPIVMFGLPTTGAKTFPSGFDWLGGVLFGPGIALALYALSIWKSSADLPAVASMISLSVVLLAWWYNHERRHPNPLIDVRQMTNMNLLLSNLGMFMLAAGVMQLTQVTSLLVQQPVETGTGLGKSATFYGAVKFPMVFAGVLGSLSAGWMILRFGHKQTIMVAAAVIIAFTTAIAFNQTNLVLILTTFAVVSIAITMIYTVIPTIIIESAPPERTSEATGIMAVFRATGQAIGAQLLAVLLSLSMVSTADGGTYTDETGYIYAYMFMAGTALALLLLTAGVRRSEPRN